MSNGVRGEREWRFYLDDMIAFAHKILSYTDGLDQYSFVADGLTYDATLIIRDDIPAFLAAFAEAQASPPVM